MPRPKTLTKQHVPTKLAEGFVDLIDDSSRFGRANYLVKTCPAVATLVVDFLLVEHRKMDGKEEDNSIAAERAWWGAYRQLRGKVLDIQYILPEVAVNLIDHLRVIETLELSFALVDAMQTRQGVDLLETL